MSKILVVNYNTGNVDSVIKAIKTCEKDVVYSNNFKDLDKAKKIILPGQGAFDQAMKELKKLNFFSKIKEKSQKENIPILGICLGMQILADKGYENLIETKGLGLIPGKVVKMKNKPNNLPHIGWNTININQKSDALFSDIENKKDFYFIHSYEFLPKSKKNILTTSVFNRKFVSAVKNNNVYGTQFHPEKSLKNGLRVIENFLKL